MPAKRSVWCMRAAKSIASSEALHHLLLKATTSDLIFLPKILSVVMVMGIRCYYVVLADRLYLHVCCHGDVEYNVIMQC